MNLIQLFQTKFSLSVYIPLEWKTELLIKLFIKVELVHYLEVFLQSAFNILNFVPFHCPVSLAAAKMFQPNSLQVLPSLLPILIITYMSMCESTSLIQQIPQHTLHLLSRSGTRPLLNNNC